MVECEKIEKIVSLATKRTFTQCLSVQRMAEDIGVCVCVYMFSSICVCLSLSLCAWPLPDSEELHEGSNCSGDCYFRPLPEKRERDRTWEAEQTNPDTRKIKKGFVTGRETKLSYNGATPGNL